MTETISENYLSEKKVSSCALPRERRSISPFPLQTLLFFYGKEIMKFLNVRMDLDIIYYIFCTVNPSVDYSDEYFKIIN